MTHLNSVVHDIRVISNQLHDVHATGSDMPPMSHKMSLRHKHTTKLTLPSKSQER
jgi:hypothetical protein